MDHFAPVKARSKIPFTMDDKTSSETRSFDSTLATSYSDSSFRVTSDGNQATVEMPNEDFYKPNVDRPTQLADTPHNVDQSSMQYSASNWAIDMDQQGMMRHEESNQRAGSIDVSQSEQSPKQYAVKHDTMNLHTQDSGRNVESANTNVLIQGRPVCKPVVSAEARSRWAMLAVLAGVSKTDDSEQIEESIEKSSEINTQFATNSEYEINGRHIMEGQGSQESTAIKSEQSKVPGNFGRLSDIVDMERVSYAQREIQDVTSAQYTSSMEKYLQSIGNDPFIDSRGFQEGLQLFNRDKECQTQDNQRVAKVDFIGKDRSQIEQSQEHLRGKENCRTRIDDGTQHFRSEASTSTSNLQLEYSRVEGNVGQDAQLSESEARTGERSTNNDMQTSELESRFDSGKNELKNNIISSVKAVEEGFQTGELAVEREFRSTKQDMAIALRSGEHILEKDLLAVAQKAEDKLRGSSLVQDFERGEQDLKDGLQMVTRDIKGTSDSQSFQGDVHRGEQELKGVFQSGENEVQQLLTGKVFQDVHQGEKNMENELRSDARTIKRVLASHGLEKDVVKGEKELKGVLDGGVRRVESEGSELLGDLQTGTRKLDGSVHASGPDQHLRQGEHEVERALHGGIHELGNMLGGQSTPGRPAHGPTQGSLAGSPSRALGLNAASTGLGVKPLIHQQEPIVPPRGGLEGSSSHTPPSTTLPGARHGDIPPTHKQGSSTPTRGGIFGGTAPSPRVAGSNPTHVSIPAGHVSTPAPSASHGQPAAAPNVRPSEPKDHNQSGPTSNGLPSIAPRNSAKQGTPQQAQGLRPQQSIQKMMPTPATQNQRLNQNSGNRQQPTTQKQHAVHQPPSSVQQNLPRPDMNMPPAGASVRARLPIHPQPHPMDVNPRNRGNQQQPHQQQSVSTMQHNQPRPTANSMQPNARPQIQHSQNQGPQAQNLDQRQPGHWQRAQQQSQQPTSAMKYNQPRPGVTVGQPGATPPARWPQTQPSQPQNAEQGKPDPQRLPKPTAYTGPSQDLAQAHPPESSFDSSESQKEPCGHGAHEPRLCPHKQKEQSCQHHGHEAYLCPHKAKAQMCSHKSHDSQSCPHQQDNPEISRGICDHQGHDVASCPHSQRAQVCDHSEHEAYSCHHRRNALKCSHMPHEANECPHEVKDNVSSNRDDILPPLDSQQSPRPQEQVLGQQYGNTQQPTSAQRLEGKQQEIDFQQGVGPKQEALSRSPAIGQKQVQRPPPPKSPQQSSSPQQANIQRRTKLEQSNTRQTSHYEEQESSQQQTIHEDRTSSTEEIDQKQSTIQKSTKSTQQLSQRQQTSIQKRSESYHQSSHLEANYESDTEQTDYEAEEQDPAPLNPFQAFLTTISAQHQAAATPNPGFFERKSSLFSKPHPLLSPNPPLSPCAILPSSPHRPLSTESSNLHRHPPLQSC